MGSSVVLREDQDAVTIFAYNLLQFNAIAKHPREYLEKTLYAVAAPLIQSAFTTSPPETLYSGSHLFFTCLSNSLPYALEAIKTSKLALQLMLSDIFKAFIWPLKQTVSAENFPLEGGLALGMIGASLLAHDLAVKRLKEDPKQASSITYGAITGTLASYVMNHNMYVGMLSGATISLIVDTAVIHITYHSVTTFFKEQTKNLHIQERIQSVQKIASQVIPYLFFTLGTALVYSRINPIISKMMEGEQIPSQKIHVIKVVATSGMLFGMMKSYTAPLAKSLLGHLQIGLQSAHDTGVIASWAPRIITILYITSLFSPHPTQ